MNQPMPLAVAVLSLLVAGWSVSTARRSVAESDRLQAEVATLRAEVASLRQGLDATTNSADEANAFAHAALNQVSDLGVRVEEVSLRHVVDGLLDGKRAHP